MAESIASILVSATLSGREHKAAVFDGTTADQNVPVRLAGLFGKCRRNCQHRRARFRKRTIESGKAKIVTDGEPEPAPRQIRQDRQFARTIIPSFAITFSAGEIDIEHMDLVV